MYLTKRFTVRPHAEVVEDIELAAELMPETRRVFLLDGDALTISARRLVPILETLRERFPQLQRVGAYANAISVNNKTDAELRQIRDLGLTIAYIGLETGDEMVNERIVKGATIDEQVEAVRRAQAAGIKMSVMTLLGMGGRARTREHARHTGEVLSRMDPRYISCLTVTPVEGTPLYAEVESGAFEMITPEETLLELEALLEHTEVSGRRLPEQPREQLPAAGGAPARGQGAAARRGPRSPGPATSRLKPEWLRGL